LVKTSKYRKDTLPTPNPSIGIQLQQHQQQQRQQPTTTTTTDITAAATTILQTHNNTYDDRSIWMKREVARCKIPLALKWD